VALSTFATATLRPSCASEITSLTPRSPRRASLRKKAVQNVSASEGADIEPENLAPAVAVDPDRDDHGNRDAATLLAHLHIGRIDPQVGPVAFDRTSKESLHPLIDLLAKPRDLALGDAAHPHRLNEIVDRTGGDALHVSLLHHRGERLLGHSARLPEAGEVAAPAQLGDAQFDRPGAGLPIPLAVAVALDKALRALLAVAGTRYGFDFQLHQPLGCKSDHLAQQIGVGGLLQKGAEVHHLVGHRWFLESGWCSATRPYRRIIDDHREAARSLQRYMGRASRAASLRPATPLAGARPQCIDVRSPSVAGSAASSAASPPARPATTSGTQVMRKIDRNLL
jgi:hypothetical protein